jgi:class 3 adenylate cyclase/Tfp pilus assembly protein PilF
MHIRSLVIFLIASFVAYNANSQTTRSLKLDSLESLLVNSKEDTVRVKILLEIANNTSCTDTSRRLNAAKEALSIAKKLHWAAGQIKSCIRTGHIYEKCHNDYSQSISYCLKGVFIAKESRDSTSQKQLYNYLGELYEKISRHDSALAYYKKSLDLNKDPWDQVGILANCGLIYNNVGDYQHALNSYEEALKLTYELLPTHSTKNDSLTFVGLLLTIGNIYVSTSQYDTALENYKSALKFSKILNKKYMQVWTLTEISKAYKSKGDLKNAVDFFEKSLELSDSINERDFKPVILDEMGKIYLESGSPAKAIMYAKRSLLIAEEDKNMRQLSKTYTTLGRIDTRLKKYNDAVKYLLKALDMSRQTGVIDDEKDTWNALSTTYEEMGQPAKALGAYRKFIELRDSVYNIAKAKEMVRTDLQKTYSNKHLADSLKQDEVKRTINLKLQKQRAFTIGGFAGLALVLTLSFFIYRNYNHQKKANKEISRVNMRIQKEKHVSETLLLNILPEEVAQELKTKGKVHAQLYDSVTVLFTDFVNFTEAGERFSPQKLVEELDACFQGFDEIINKYNIEKIKTVGDAYLAVAGLPIANPDHARDMVAAAIEIRDFMKERKEKLGDDTFGIRLGINSGNVVAGIVGVKKFAYDIWGDTVNTACRMEQNSEPGKINISESTYELLQGKYNCVYRGKIQAKNKGEIDMYFVS